MHRNRKIFFNRQVVLVTARTEQGLPFVASEHMNLILNGILARAQAQYPVSICHYVWMANHVHILLVVENPEDIPLFVGRIKTESAHAINRLLGIRKQTVWAERYDSPVILSAEDTIRYIKYIYLNPARANLVESINDYPGVSSWSMFQSGTHSIKHPWIQRTSISSLPEKKPSEQQLRRYTQKLRKEAKSSHLLQLSPNAWMQCFAETEDASAEVINAQIFRELQVEEQELRKKRTRPVLGAQTLKRASMKKKYRPKKFSRRMICICSDITLRLEFINYCKELMGQAREVFLRWKAGDFSKTFPPGLFPPGRLRAANTLNPFAYI